MKRHVQRILAGVGLVLGAVLLPAVAQQPPPKPPVLPPINPAAAKPDTILGRLDGPGFAVAAHEDAGLFAASCDQGTIHCWQKDVAHGIRAGDAASHVLKGHQGPVIDLAWRGPLLASAGVDQKLILWDMPSGKVLHTLTATAPVRSLALSPDGKTLAVGGEDAAVHLWDTASGKATTKLAGHTDWVLALAFAPDGKTLASGGHDGFARLWDVAAGKKLLDMPARTPPQPNQPPPDASSVQSLAFAPDGKSLAAGAADGQVHLFSLPDGKHVRAMPGHASAVTGLAFHASGTLLVSASKDRTVRLWNPANGQAVKVLEGHTAWVEGVTFLAQGTRLASVSADGTVRLWDLTGK